MHVDLTIVLAGLLVGFTVGLTGMGGGALMTPILVLVFKIDPLTAVSSDLVASFVMKPVGAGVHLRRGTVNLRLVRWLVLGSVPSAFAGVLLLRTLGDGPQVQDTLRVLLGATLLVAASTIVAKAVFARRRGPVDASDATAIVVRPLPTVVIGVVGGLVVGMTSVGSGSLMIVALLLLYPTLRASQLVGTDLVQAIPLVGAASLGHILFGDFQLGLTTSLLIGAVPAVYVGARLSARAPDRLIRPVLIAVLSASALKLLGVGTPEVGLILAAGIVAAVVAALVARRSRNEVGGETDAIASPPPPSSPASAVVGGETDAIASP